MAEAPSVSARIRVPAPLSSNSASDDAEHEAHAPDGDEHRRHQGGHRHHVRGDAAEVHGRDESCIGIAKLAYLQQS